MMRPWRLVLVVAAMVLGAELVVARPAEPQWGRPVPSTGRILVQATVDQADGKPALGLTRDNFEVLVDGEPRPIESLSSADGPVSVVLLLDVTASMRMGNLSSGITLQRAVDQWFPFSLKPGDRARIGTIAKHLFLSDRFTSVRHEINQAGFAARTPPPADKIGPSPIWDAVDAATSALEWEDGQRAILLFTDGRSTGNRVSLREATTHATIAGASVHVIAERDAPASIYQVDGTEVAVAPGAGLRTLADRTGGTYISDRPFPWSDPGPLFARVLESLHHAYTIGFAPAALDGKVHTVEIKVNTPGLTVRARKSFLADYK
jgi:VWFA-related protein